MKPSFFRCGRMTYTPASLYDSKGYSKYVERNDSRERHEQYRMSCQYFYSSNAEYKEKKRRYVVAVVVLNCSSFDGKRQPAKTECSLHLNKIEISHEYIQIVNFNVRQWNNYRRFKTKRFRATEARNRERGNILLSLCSRVRWIN